MKLLTLFVLPFFLSVTCFCKAEIKTSPVEYKEGDTTLSGFVSFDITSHSKKPGVLVFHDWMGVSDFVKERAGALASLGYVAFVADVYGKDNRPKNTEEAGKIAGSFKANRELLRRRAQAALSALLLQPKVDTANIAAIGYCFGGTAALELARDGAPLKGVVSFHGGLQSLNKKDASNIKAKILVLHGADDPFVPPEEVKSFEDEMRTGKIDWQLYMFGNAVHAFSQPLAGNDNSKGAAYNEAAARRSWQAMKNFLQEIFPSA